MNEDEMMTLVEYLNDESAPVPVKNKNEFFNKIVRITPAVFHGDQWHLYSCDISGDGVRIDLGNERIHINLGIEGCETSFAKIDPRFHNDESLIALITRLKGGL